jgi:CHASE3 domain sensor protein
MEPLEKEILQGELDKAKKALADKEQELLGLKNENEELTKKLSDSEKAIQAQKDKEAVEYVENLVKVGKLKNESKEAVIESAKKDLSLVKNVYDSIPAPTVQRLSNVAASGKVETKVNEDWTIRDYEKKDPKGLLKIKNEQPEVYQAMFDAEYKK